MGYLSVRDIAEMSIEAASEHFAPDYIPDERLVTEFLDEIEALSTELSDGTEMLSVDFDVDPDTMEITVVFVMEDGTEDYVFDGVWVKR